MGKNLFDIGNSVTVVDTAWSQNLTNLSMERVKRKAKAGEIRTFRVIAVNCSVPVERDRCANTLIQSDDDMHVYAINDCNLMLNIVGIGIQYVTQGKNVTAVLSEQSKQAILRAHLQACN